MNPDILKYIEDINISIQAIENHIQNINSLHEYQNDLKTTDSVERRLAIIGEALFKIEKLDKEALNITDKQKIIRLRHILIHDYDLIEDSTIWDIVKKKLPLLKTEILNLLNN